MQVFNIFEALIFGWVLGLVVNYLADVLPITRTFSSPKCRRCQERLTLLRYFLFITCPSCGVRRSIRTWIVQALIPLGLLWLVINPPGRLLLWMCAILISFFMLVAVIDYEHRAILLQESFLGLIIGIGVGFHLHGLIPTILGGLAGFVMMLLLYYFGIIFASWLSRSRGQVNSEVGLGFGDVTLSGVLGFMLGWPGIIAGLVLAILLAGLASVFYLLFLIVTHRYKLFSSIPYGPFLVLGSAILLFRP